MDIDGDPSECWSLASKSPNAWHEETFFTQRSLNIMTFAFGIAAGKILNSLWGSNNSTLCRFKAL